MVVFSVARAVYASAARVFPREHGFNVATMTSVTFLRLLVPLGLVALLGCGAEERGRETTVASSSSTGAGGTGGSAPEPCTALGDGLQQALDQAAASLQ